MGLLMPYKWENKKPRSSLDVAQENGAIFFNREKFINVLRSFLQNFLSVVRLPIYPQPGHF